MANTPESPQSIKLPAELSRFIGRMEDAGTSPEEMSEILSNMHTVYGRILEISHIFNIDPVEMTDYLLQLFNINVNIVKRGNATCEVYLDASRNVTGYSNKVEIPAILESMFNAGLRRKELMAVVSNDTHQPAKT